MKSPALFATGEGYPPGQLFSEGQGEQETGHEREPQSWQNS